MNNRGLTLIELIVVMGIVGVLATVLITLVNPQSQFAKANDAKRKSDLAQIQRSLELYYNDTKSYPADDAVPFGLSWSPYMSKVPQDPRGGRKYQYKQIDSNTYCLFASLEYENDPQKCSSTPCARAATEIADCGTSCNYGACSPNISVDVPTPTPTP